jgi:transcriptional regulator with XRE-family HTH domain
MNTDTMPTKKVHHGRNVKRLREMLGVKQEAVAFELEMSQQSMSLLEQKEEIEDNLLEKIAKVLQIPVDAIKNMDDDATYNYINTFNDVVTNNGTFTMTNPYNCTFNPIDKVVELFERLLKAEQERNVLLEKLLSEKK